MNQAQSKNQEVQSAIQQQIQFLILIQELLAIIASIIPGFVWPGWSKRVDETTDDDLATLTPEQASSWANAVTDEYTRVVGPG